MIKPGGSGSHTVLEFRRAVAQSPVHPAVWGRDVSLGVASPISPPSDSPQQDHARSFDLPRFLKASESLSETLLRQRSDALYWQAWLSGAAVGTLITSIIALLWWPR